MCLLTSEVFQQDPLQPYVFQILSHFYNTLWVQIPALPSFSYYWKCSLSLQISLLMLNVAVRKMWQAVRGKEGKIKTCSLCLAALSLEHPAIWSYLFCLVAPSGLRVGQEKSDTHQ